jgi:hypothetical protein
MTLQSNSNYLEKYASGYAQLICDGFFSNRQFISGQEIIQLTPCAQVNFFVIKRLFELWQEELGKLKSSPFFDYRDIAVHEALTQFMNILSRRIKVERTHVEGMLRDAVVAAVHVACDPVNFFQQEVEKAPQEKINAYLKENKKYYKWNDRLVTSLIDKAGMGLDLASYQSAIAASYGVLQNSLEPADQLLSSLGEAMPFDLNTYWGRTAVPSYSFVPEPVQEAKIGEAATPDLASEEVDEDVYEDELIQEELFSEEVAEDEITPEESFSSTLKSSPEEELVRAAPAASIPSGKLLNAAQLQALFATETYKGMKGILGELAESLALNQRFMFTKELFDGNADLLRHALKSVDEVGSFAAAVDLINARYVIELGWDIESEEVREFMQQVYRKFVR